MPDPFICSVSGRTIKSLSGLNLHMASCPPCRLCGPPIMQHYGVNGYSLHAMNSLSAMYNLHQQAAQQAQHAPDYRPSVHALTLAERLAGKKHLLILLGSRLFLLISFKIVTSPCKPLFPSQHFIIIQLIFRTLPFIKLLVFLVSQRLHISRHHP